MSESARQSCLSWLGSRLESDWKRVAESCQSKKGLFYWVFSMVKPALAELQATS
jgi:hypothetical protein